MAATTSWRCSVATTHFAKLERARDYGEARALAEFARYCRTAPGTPVWESVDLFVFQTR
jgi:hypothetical protein